jgi:hypothetical protein
MKQALSSLISNNTFLINSLQEIMEISFFGMPLYMHDNCPENRDAVEGR